ncbi:MAG: phytoene desaturase family protein [Bacteroidota bacterium]
MKKVTVIGSGFAGLSTACFLAQQGVEVTVIEKNDQAGGRARVFREKGFTFDMGPSWYWMPDVFERFFNQFNTTTSDFYKLIRLDPSYQVIWDDETLGIPANFQELQQLFERIEPGAAGQLVKFLGEAGYKYHTSMSDLVFKPGLSITEYMSWDVAKSALRIDLLNSIHKHVRKYFSHPKLIQLAEFPILFLGALPKNTPALYSMMNYADMKLGTWYPMGGMTEIVKAIALLAKNLGVKFKFNESAVQLIVSNGSVVGVKTVSNNYVADAVVFACDYAHADQNLTPIEYRNYTESYWESRKMAPSSLLYYIGLNKKVEGMLHHNLMFDAPFAQHADELYTIPSWPKNPLMYICCPSKTDSSVAPIGHENIFALIPVAPGMADNEAIREHYYDILMKRIEKRFGQDVRNNVVYQRSYAHNDFVTDYNAFKGNAYGLANTLQQTAFMKPSIRNKKLKNLFYTGQLTVPGPGVPPALISGEIVAKEVSRLLKIKPTLV